MTNEELESMVANGSFLLIINVTYIHQTIDQIINQIILMQTSNYKTVNKMLISDN